MQQASVTIKFNFTLNQRSETQVHTWQQCCKTINIKQITRIQWRKRNMYKSDLICLAQSHPLHTVLMVQQSSGWMVLCFGAGGGVHCPPVSDTRLQYDSCSLNGSDAENRSCQQEQPFQPNMAAPHSKHKTINRKRMLGRKKMFFTLWVVSIDLKTFQVFNVRSYCKHSCLYPVWTWAALKRLWVINERNEEGI